MNYRRGAKEVLFIYCVVQCVQRLPYKTIGSVMYPFTHFVYRLVLTVAIACSISS